MYVQGLGTSDSYGSAGDILKIPGHFFKAIIASH